jgi:uncharacterized membrane protein
VTGGAAPIVASRELARATRHILAFTRAGFVVVGTVPLWLPLARAYLPAGALGDGVDGAFVLLCHRMAERTLSVAGVPMPLCSRCAGIFLGLALGIAVAWPRLSLRATRYALLGAGLLMLADVVTQDLGIHGVWHVTRLATGGLLGYVCASALVAAIVRHRHELEARAVAREVAAQRGAFAGAVPGAVPEALSATPPSAEHS